MTQNIEMCQLLNVITTYTRDFAWSIGHTMPMSATMAGLTHIPFGELI